MRSLLHILLMMALLVPAACRNADSERRATLAALYGTVITLPQQADGRILNTPVRIGSPEGFRIVTYIDSAGCTPCRMRLNIWRDVIGELLADGAPEDTPVDLVMIVRSPRRPDIDFALRRELFPYPVWHDSTGIFAAANSFNHLLSRS